jgi:hypothetical protein
LYVDCVSCPGFADIKKESPISFWTAERLKKRENMEINNGGFGLGNLVDMYVDREDYNIAGEDGKYTEDKHSDVEERLLATIDAKDINVSLFMLKLIFVKGYIFGCHNPIM